MDLGLNGKVALVTGASRGIGNRIALALAAEGMNLSICGRTATTLEAAAEQIRGLGVEVESYVGDITASAGAERFVATAKARFGEQIHVLVNNVGFGMMGEHVEQDSKKLERMLTLNNILLSKLCMLVGAKMKARGTGQIMNIGSLAGFCPMPFFAAYSASKAFVINFSASLHEELKPYGVQVTCFCPSTTKTAFLDTAQSKHQSSSGITKFVSAQIDTPEEVAIAGYKALNEKKTFALPSLPITLQSIWIRTMPLRYMANFVFKKSLKEQ